MKRGIADMAFTWCGPIGVRHRRPRLPRRRLPPPPDPGDTPAQLAAYWADDVDLKRVGLILIGIGSALFIAFASVWARSSLRHIDGEGSPLAFLQIAAGALTGGLGIVYAFFMLAIAFRPDRPPEITTALTDLAWLPFIGLWMTAVLQAVAIGHRHPLGPEREAAAPALGRLLQLLVRARGAVGLARRVLQERTVRLERRVRLLLRRGRLPRLVPRDVLRGPPGRSSQRNRQAVQEMVWRLLGTEKLPKTSAPE